MLNQHQVSTLAVTLSQFSSEYGCFGCHNFLVQLQAWGDRMGARTSSPSPFFPNDGYATDTDEEDQARS